MAYGTDFFEALDKAVNDLTSVERNGNAHAEHGESEFRDEITTMKVTILVNAYYEAEWENYLRELWASEKEDDVAAALRADNAIKT